MRILFLSNYYPPYEVGGYEQWCAEVAAELQRRGHTVEVVSSRVRGATSPVFGDIPVHRVLDLEAQDGMWQTALEFPLRSRRASRTLDDLQQVLVGLRPDVALIWGMWNVPRAVPASVERALPGRVAYYLCDYWPTLPSAYEQYWRTPSGRLMTKSLKAWAARTALRQLQGDAQPVLQLQNCYFVSRAVRQHIADAGVPFRGGEVIYGGVQVDQFEATRSASPAVLAAAPMRLLYVGRICADKGLHTVVQALGKLPRGTVSLTTCGDDSSVYARGQRAEALRLGIADSVSFVGSVPHSQMPYVMSQHDVLVFPSIWQEPFARTVLEAMAARLVVLGTTTGGTNEVLREGDTGLTFPPSDSDALAGQIRRLVEDANLRIRLSAAGYHVVRTAFTFERMADAIESELNCMATRGCSV